MVADVEAKLDIRSSEDVVRVRQAVRALAIRTGLTLVDQTKVVTAASELARNALDYGGGGVVTLERVMNGSRPGIRLIFEDQGPGHTRHQSGAQGRIYHRRGFGTWAERRKAAIQRILYPIKAW